MDSDAQGLVGLLVAERDAEEERARAMPLPSDAENRGLKKDRRDFEARDDGYFVWKKVP